MGLYGITQQLGSGTFSFDRICPNRYLLDRLANEDSVLPGRYALVEYDKLIAKVARPDDNDTFTYEEGKKLYDIIPMKKNGSNMKIDMTEGSTEYIFVCSDPVLNDQNAGKYDFYYIDNETKHFNHYGEGPMTPSEFNKEVDRAYAQKDSTDDISSDLAELWDSTAWLKIINESKFKYIKVANLNVVIPSFTATDSIDSFYTDSDGNFIYNKDGKPKHNQPEVKSTNESGVFNINFPKFPDVSLKVKKVKDENDNEDGNEDEDDDERVSTTYKPNEINFELNIPELKGMLDLIKYPQENGIWPTNNGKMPDTPRSDETVPTDAGVFWSILQRANSAGNTSSAGIINTIGADSITVTIGGANTSLTEGKLNIKALISNDNLITANELQNLWNLIVVT